MHSISVLSSLALVGYVFAAPVAEPNVVITTKWSTVYVTAGIGAGIGLEPAAQKTTIKAPPAPSSPSKPITVQTSSEKPISMKPTMTAQLSTTKPKPSQPTTSAKPATSGAAASSSSSDPAYMAIVNEWRVKMNLAKLAFNATLQANALKTCNDGNGKMVHELNPGTFGQVLAPGSSSDFEKVFVGGWLCEVPSTPGLNGACNTYSKGWAYQGQTGHNAILVSTKYKHIGCANAKGIWSCDLGN